MAAIIAVALAAPVLAQAQDRTSFEGTWGGVAGDDTAQVIVAGGEVIGFYWRGDYVDASDAHVSADGRVLTFTFAGGRAMLTRTGAETATIVVTDAKGAASVDLRRG